MAHIAQIPATLDDLYREAGKAELIGGRIVHLMVTGRRPNRVAGRIFRHLDEYTELLGKGEAYTDNMGFAVAGLVSGRESFSPDASYFAGPFLTPPMRFVQGPPTFAAEVRSENDYGDAAEIDLAEKRADYFAAGTLVVWDVDPVNDCIHVYRYTDPTRPTTYVRGQTADAEPAVPGWLVAVEWSFHCVK
jgi:Uma2 family endonuclease